MKNHIIGLLFVLMFFVPFSVQAKTGECISGNCQNGYGTSRFSDGSEYKGRWKKGNAHGRGTYTSPKGTLSGIFANGSFVGPDSTEGKNSLGHQPPKDVSKGYSRLSLNDCKQYSELAEVIMENRQLGADKQFLMTVAKMVEDKTIAWFGEQLVKIAYDIRIYNTEEKRLAASRKFRDINYNYCVKQLQE